ncbi:MAG: three-Cys-motif partner protein TcmP, partial [Chloroflexi bacterium]|nr:three-Cys-motif partner protein TcmP [Chloroflexota bacterium]
MWLLMSEFKYDEIGYWSEVKHAIVKDYAGVYTQIMHVQPHIKKYLYIDAFAGVGHHILKRTGDFVHGSPLYALKVKHPF